MRHRKALFIVFITFISIVATAPANLFASPKCAIEIRLENITLCASITWTSSNSPKASIKKGEYIENTFQLRFWNKADNSVYIDPPKNFSIYLGMDMCSTGPHGYDLTAERIRQGEYKVEEVYFSMRGDWKLQFEFKDEDDGDIIKCNIPITVLQ